MEADNAGVSRPLQGLDLLVQSLLAEGAIPEDDLHGPLLLGFSINHLPHLGIGSTTGHTQK